MHPIQSLYAHYQSFISKHFERSLSGRKIAKYKNLYLGQRCFIVANGPSLTAKDLETLHQHKEITFGMNRIYKIFSETSWRPTFYVCEDELIVQGQRKEISEISAEEKFIPVELKWYHNVVVSGARYFHLNYNVETASQYGFSSNAAHQLDCRGTVTYTCMQLAAYMGFSQIYLLGVDHNYQRTIDINGNVIEDPNAKDYFCEGYDTDIKDLVIHDMGNNTRAYMDAKQYCDATKRTTIYNATRGGKLEVFPRVDFDQLFV